jgi:hypothetical protein
MRCALSEQYEITLFLRQHEMQYICRQLPNIFHDDILINVHVIIKLTLDVISRDYRAK